MGRTLRWIAIGIVVVAVPALGIFVMPPLFRDIALALLKAIAIAIAGAAYAVFVALSMRGSNR